MASNKLFLGKKSVTIMKNVHTANIITQPFWTSRKELKSYAGYKANEASNDKFNTIKIKWYADVNNHWVRVKKILPFFSINILNPNVAIYVKIRNEIKEG